MISELVGHSLVYAGAGGRKTSIYNMCIHMKTQVN